MVCVSACMHACIRVCVHGKGQKLHINPQKPTSDAHQNKKEIGTNNKVVNGWIREGAGVVSWLKR